MHIVTVIFLLVIWLFSAAPVSAHAFGQSYNLPIPVWLYLFSGGTTLIVSFLIIGFFITQTKKDTVVHTKSVPALKVILNPLLQRFLKFLALALFIFTIITGLFGTSLSYFNFNMTAFWVLFLLGLSYFCVVFGDIYSVINPIKTILHSIEAFLGEELEGVVHVPQKLGYLPALSLYFAFIYLELIAHSTPMLLSIMLILYVGIASTATVLFGKVVYFEYIDFFAVYFRLLGKISLFKTRDQNVVARPFFLGLLEERADHLSILIFILFMLSSTAFDGFRSTTVWYKVVLNFLQPYSPLVSAKLLDWIQIICLIASPFIFFACYGMAIAGMKIITKSKASLHQLSLDFAYSLIPIAVVYNIAHYYTLLLTQGQLIVSLISDPFGWGWNLFGTKSFTPNITFIDAGFVWHSQVALIVLGHVAAVYIAHLVSLKAFSSHKKALLSQIPMLFLMILYTMAGLWILSQPLSTGG